MPRDNPTQHAINREEVPALNDLLTGLRETIHAQATRLAMQANTIKQLREVVRGLQEQLYGRQGEAKKGK